MSATKEAPTITIRKARVPDYELFLKMRAELDAMLLARRPGHDMVRSEEWALEFKLRTGEMIVQAGTLVFLAFVGERPAGFLVGELFPITGSGDAGGCCSEIFVREQFRGDTKAGLGGVAGALVKSALHAAKQLRLSALQALVLDVLPDHQARLMRAGFRPIGRVMERRFSYEQPEQSRTSGLEG